MYSPNRSLLVRFREHVFWESWRIASGRLGWRHLDLGQLPGVVEERCAGASSRVWPTPRTHLQGYGFVCSFSIATYFSMRLARVSGFLASWI
jgi:hypothetical protein